MLNITRVVLLLLTCLLASQANAIEMVINGTTYNIDKYEITNNGQRIVVNHNSFRMKQDRVSSCRKIRPYEPIKVKRTPSSYKKTNDTLRDFRNFIKTIDSHIPSFKKKPAKKKSHSQSYQ